MILNVAIVYLKLICLGSQSSRGFEEICQDRSLSRGLVQRTFPVRKRGRREEAGRGVFQICQRQIGSLVIFDVFFTWPWLNLACLQSLMVSDRMQSWMRFCKPRTWKKSAWKLGIIKIHKATNESVLCTSKKWESFI